MQILLFGKPNSITSTIADMLNSNQEWSITVVTSDQDTTSISTADNNEQPSYKLILANLDGFSRKPNRLVAELNEQFANTPLLVMYSYTDPMLIAPLLNAGADGYLQTGHSEDEIFEAVRVVASGARYIKPNFTYSQ